MKKGESGYADTFEIVGVQVLANVHGVALGLSVLPNKLMALQLDLQKIQILRQHLTEAETILRSQSKSVQ